MMGGAGTIQKIGQWPSSADLADRSLRHYKKALQNTDFKEFSKAVGLEAHGVGIGAFVYLRRIFERLIDGAQTQAKTDGISDIPNKMDDRIQALKGYLPEFLVEHRKLYGIISKGIHELSEDDCLEAFPVVRTAIELILDDVLAKKAKEEKVKQTSAALTVLQKKHESQTAT